MEDHSIFGYRDARTEGCKVAVHPRNHVAFAIGRRKNDRIARAVGGALRLGKRRTLRIDAIANSGSMCRREKARSRYGRKIRVGVVLIEVCIRKLLRLDEKMPVAGICGSEGGKSLPRRPTRHACL